jgi:hypothetical protein
MSWRGVALALALVWADLAVTSCAARRWAADEADRIDAVMGTGGAADAGEESPKAPMAMGPAPPLAAPTGPRRLLTVSSPWSAPYRNRGARFYLGRQRRSPAIGRDTAGFTR